MTDRRTPKWEATTPAPRPLLNLGGGDRRGLERAFQALVGKPQTGLVAPVLSMLHDLGFTMSNSEKSPGQKVVTHFLATGREVALQASEVDAQDPEGWALKWAAHHFPEMEFYLPYISLRSALARRKVDAKAGLPPEPDYDEDGFLVEYPG